MKPQSISLLLASLASLAAADCATTLSKNRPCCPPSAGHTATAYVDCEGCSLETAYPTNQPACACSSPLATAPSSTTTITTCVPSVSLPIATGSDLTSTKTVPLFSKPCTTTYTAPVYECCPFGEAGHTTTTYLHCGGCALESAPAPPGPTDPICTCPSPAPPRPEATTTIPICMER